MIVVADTGPLNYLLLIGHVDALPSLFTRIVIPGAVADELASGHAPKLVRTWIANPPTWLEIEPDRPDDGTLRTLDSGERSAIALGAIDEGVACLVEAHRRQLLDFDSALGRLSMTSFYVSRQLVDRIRRLL